METGEFVTATEEKPEYRKFRQDDGGATPIFGISCNEGWRESIVCTGMYEFVADWLLAILQGKPFAKHETERRS